MDIYSDPHVAAIVRRERRSSTFAGLAASLRAPPSRERRASIYLAPAPVASYSLKAPKLVTPAKVAAGKERRGSTFLGPATNSPKVTVTQGRTTESIIKNANRLETLPERGSDSESEDEDLVGREI